jgi:uncharacterized membrane protein YhiD involved in acid resistance
MAPFWSGVAIGLAIGAVIFLACIIFAVVVVAVRLTCFCARAFAADRQSAPSFMEYWRQGRARAARTSALRQKQSRDRAARIKAWGQARREKDLAWMERHWATRWCACLNRRLPG